MPILFVFGTLMRDVNMSDSFESDIYLFNQSDDLVQRIWFSDSVNFSLFFTHGIQLNKMLNTEHEFYRLFA